MTYDEDEAKSIRYIECFHPIHDVIDQLIPDIFNHGMITKTSTQIPTSINLHTTTHLKSPQNPSCVSPQSSSPSLFPSTLQPHQQSPIYSVSSTHIPLRSSSADFGLRTRAQSRYYVPQARLPISCQASP